MKFGVIGDIHGNLYALEAIVAKLRGQGVTHYLIAGDLISDCNYPNEVLDLIQTLDVTVIKGNREDYVLEYLDGLHPEWENLHQMASVVWTAKQLTDKNVDYLRTLPYRAQVKVENQLITLVHGSPFDCNEHLYEDKNQDRLQEAVEFVKSDVLICAHSHKQWQKQVNQTLVFNPGASGVHFNKESEAEYAILEISNQGPKLTHHKASYDLKEFREYMRSSSLYEAAPMWVNLIIDSIECCYNANVTFLKQIFSTYEIKGFIPNEIWEVATKTWDRNSFIRK